MSGQGLLAGGRMGSNWQEVRGLQDAQKVLLLPQNNPSTYTLKVCACFCMYVRQSKGFFFLIPIFQCQDQLLAFP